MFKAGKGKCVKCSKDSFIVVKAMLCSRCNAEKKAISKASRYIRPNVTTKDILGHDKIIQKLQKILKKKPYKPTGELEFFKFLWETREHICQVTGEYIRRFDISCFSHLLSKAAYPSLRLDPNNVWLVTREVHNEYHTGDLKHPKWDKKKEARELLKQKYYEQNKIGTKD